jgi:drug/metabolite transporter (DMT)-like permease
VGAEATKVHDGRVGTRVWAALWVVYILWGSTYLAIRVAVHPTHGVGLPPLLLAGVRFTVAGLLMLAFAVRRPAADRQPDPMGRRQWVAAAVVGTALLLGGNGLVSIAEQRIASGVAALVVATVPIWAALLGAVWGHERITARNAAGLVLGFAGVAALVGGTGGGRVSVTGVLIVVAAALSWAAGSVWSRTAPTVRRPLVMTGMEMLCGGIACLLVGLAIGEAGDVHLSAAPATAWVGLAYLVVFGSLIAYTAYVWLLHNAPLSLVTTYAFVNPLVAVLLGTVLLSEPFTARTLLASALIVAGVALIVMRRATPAPVVTAATAPEVPDHDGGRAAAGRDAATAECA